MGRKKGLIEYKFEKDKLIGPLKRNAAVFIAIVFMSLLLGIGQTWLNSKAYVSEIGLRYDSILLARYAFTPTIDEIMAQSKDVDFLERVRKESGVAYPLSVIAKSITVFKSPTFNNHLTVSVKLRAPEGAEKIARAASGELIDYVNNKLSKVRAYYGQQVTGARKQLKEIDVYQKRVGNGSSTQDIQVLVMSAGTRNELNSKILDGEQKLIELNNIFVIEGDPITKKSTPISELVIAGALAAVIGLILGYGAVTIIDRAKMRGSFDLAQDR